MKKIIISSSIALLLLGSCSSNETEKETKFIDGWELDFSGWELDFSGWELDLTKPYVQNFSSKMQRDSIIGALSYELFEADASSVGKEESKIVLISLNVSAEDHTVTTHLIGQDQDINVKELLLISSCMDATCMSDQINKTLTQNPSATIILKKDLSSTEVQLFDSSK